MHAHLLTSYGPTGLQPAQIDEPPLAAGQVKIRIEAIAINPLDWKIRNGWLAQMIRLDLPAVIGSEAAGTVLEVGSGVDDFAPGDRVTGFIDSGAFAEVGVTRAARLARIPDGLSTAIAATIPTAAETADRIHGMLAPSAGSTIVVNGAAGSVGSMLVQLLLDGHDYRVIGTAGPANHDFVRGLGATPVGYGDTLLDELRAAAPEGVAAAFDTTGHGFIGRVEGLIPATSIVTIADFAAGAHGALVAGGDPTQLMVNEAVRDALQRAAAGALHTPIAGAFDFAALPEALDLSERGHLRGKVVVAGYGTRIDAEEANRRTRTPVDALEPTVAT